MKEPRTKAEWQEACDAAEAFLHLESARQYGLVTGGPKVNSARCEQILSRGRTRGITPSPDCVERLVKELSRA